MVWASGPIPRPGLFRQIGAPAITRRAILPQAPWLCARALVPILLPGEIITMTRRLIVGCMLLLAIAQVAGPVQATEAEINLSGTEGLVTLSASASFTAYEHCNEDDPPDCTSVNSGNLEVYHNGHFLACQSDNGSADWSTTIDCGLLSQGEHTYTAKATDSEDIVYSDSTAITIDNTPSVHLDELGAVEGDFRSTGSVVFKPCASKDEGAVHVFLGNEWNQIFYRSYDTTGATFETDPIDAGALTNGSHKVLAFAQAANGTISPTIETPFSVDNTPVIALNDGGAVEGDFSVTGTVGFKPCRADKKGAVHVFLDKEWNQIHYQEFFSTNGAYETGPIDAGALTNGSHTFIAFAQATNGAISPKVETQVTVNNTPVITLQDPGLVEGNFSVSGTFAFKPCHADKKGAVYVLLDSEWNLIHYQECFSTNGSFETGPIDAGALTNGPHKCMASAQATNGSTCATLEGQIWVDNTPSLTLAVENPQWDEFRAVGSAHFKPYAGGNDGVIYFHMDSTRDSACIGQTEIEGTEVSFVLPVTCGHLQNGVHTIYALGRATNGARSAWVQTDFEVDNTPRLTLTAPRQAEGEFDLVGEVTFSEVRSQKDGVLTVHLDGQYIGTKYYDTRPAGFSYAEFAGQPLNAGDLQTGWHTFMATAKAFSGATAQRSVTFEVAPLVLKKNLGSVRAACKTLPRAGNPINYATGNKYERATDLDLDGPGLPLRLVRHYNSQSVADAPLGFGWRIGYDQQLQNAGNHRILHQADGRQVHFIDDGTGRFVSETDPVRIVEAIDGGGHRLSEPDGRRLTFDTAGRLVHIVDRNGNAQEMVYVDGRLDSVSDNFGRRLDFVYTSDGRLATIGSPVGVFTYLADADGNLERVVKPDDTVCRYRYEDPNDIHNLTGIVDENGVRAATFAYDGTDRAVSSEHAGGAGRVTVTYGSNFTRQITDARGNVTTAKLQVQSGIGRIQSTTGAGCSNCLASVGESYEYDARFYTVAETDARGHVKRFVHDTRGNVLSRTEAEGTDTERTIAFTWHPQWRLPTSISRTSVAAPGQTAMTEFAYDPAGNLIAQTERGFGPDGAISRSTHYSWNALGQMTAIDGPRSDVTDLTTLTYYPNTVDQGCDRARLHTVTDPLGHDTRYEAYDAWGHPQRITGPNLVVTLLGYDTMGRLTSAATAGRTTVWDYDPAGRLIAVHAPDGRSLAYAYTPAGQMASISDDLGQSIVYSYDTEGNRIGEEIRDAQGNPTYRLDFDYDEFNRLAAVLYPDGTVQTCAYDEGGLLLAISDGAGRTTQYEHDPLGRRVRMRQPGALETAFAYDSHDNLVSVTDAEGHETTYAYDDLGRIFRQVSPDTGITIYASDAAGNITAKTDANGVTTGYGYDAAGRLIQVAFADSSQDIAYQYDADANGKGRLTGMTDPSGTYAYRFDPWGELVSEEKTVAGIVYATGYGYDEAGHLTETIYPDGRHVTYDRDAAGRIVAVATQKDGVARQLASGGAYLPFGPLAGLTLGSGVQRSIDHDLSHRPLRIRVTGLLDYDYTWDAAGNITAIADLLDATKTRHFVYDDLDRLTGAQGPFGSIGYSYDAIGNRLSKTENAALDLYTYAPGTSRLVAVTGPNAAVYASDANGNVTAMGTRQLSYNQNNRLVQVTGAGTVLGDYVYNGKGQRIVKTTAEETRVFHYDTAGNLIAESDESGNFTAAYIYMDDQRLAAVGPSVSDALTAAVVTDHGRGLAGIRLYVFTEAGAYTGTSATTDEDGRARFALADFTVGRYKLRADYLGCRFWSEPLTLPGTHQAIVEIAEAPVTVQVTRAAAPAAGVRVYLFGETGTYLGRYADTGADGTATFDLPADRQFRFRADILGQRVMSEAFAVQSGASNCFTVPTGGGDLVVTLQRAPGEPLAGVRLYLFSNTGTYLGRSGDTDDSGRVVFAVPAGAYTLRADYLGQRFWTDAIAVQTDTPHAFTLPHRETIVTVTGDLAGDLVPLSGVRVYLFTAAGSYAGRWADTDEDGRVMFSLPAADFKVRADCCGGRYFSAPFNFADAALIIAQADAAVRVTGMGLGLSDVRVYVFSAGGSYLNLSGDTDADGFIHFRLPAADYDFRADYLGSRYFSGPVTLIAHQVNPVPVSTGGGAFTLRLLKRPAEPLAAVRCYLFSDAGSYLGQTGNTSDAGELSFNLADGLYKIRSDYLNYRFWTDTFAVPDTQSLEHLILHEQTAFQVLGDCAGDIQARTGVRVYLFSPAESYTGVWADADADGRIVFDLPTEAFKLRADYLGGRFWKEITGGSDDEVIIEEGIARVTVRQGSADLENVRVYLFSESGAYLGRYATTDAQGLAAFRLPAASYSFRADHLGNRYWAMAEIAAHEENDVLLDTGGGPFVLHLTRGQGLPLADVPVYAFTESGSYIGLSGRSDAAGDVVFALSDGHYSFRADYLGQRFWLDHTTVPDFMSDTLEIAHRPVTVTVSSVYGALVEPLPAIKTYLFTESGSYAGLSLTTDADGHAAYEIPCAPFAVRADYCGGRFWSDTILDTDTEIDIDIAHGLVALTAQSLGSPAQGARVYLFSESGSYLGKTATTDADGRADLLIPEGPCKLRIDYSGTRHWTGVIHVLPHEQTDLQLDLDQLASELTHDPNPGRFDGKPPEPEPLLLASIGSLSHLLANAATAYTPPEDEVIYYYINDHLGTPQRVIDQDGNVVWAADYKPFGEVNEAVGAFDNRFRFPGQYFDSKTGLHYNYHRYYGTKTGRYVTPDPIGLGKGINLYTYVKGNPIIRTDSLGLWLTKGYCRYISGGEGVGVGQMRCRVWTECGTDGYREVGELVTLFAGITVGLPASVTYFNIEQDSRGFTNGPSLSELTGLSSIYTISSALGVGSSITVLNLGSTTAEYGSEAYQAGIDASADAFLGYSWIEWSKREECCE